MIVRLHADAEAELSLATRLPRPDSRATQGELIVFEWIGLNKSQLEQVYQIFDEYWASCHRLEYIHQRDNHAPLSDL